MKSVLDLLEDRLRILPAVQSEEDFPHHRLLVLGEEIAHVMGHQAEWVETLGWLPRQHIIVFRKRAPRE